MWDGGVFFEVLPGQKGALLCREALGIMGTAQFDLVGG